MMRSCKRVTQLNIKLGIVHIMQEHIDAAEIIGCRVNFLTIKLYFRCFFTNIFHKLHQQGTRTAGWVINLLNIRIVAAGYAGKYFTHLLWRKIFTATFTSLRCIHLHQVFVGVAYCINTVVCKRLAELHITHLGQHLGNALVTHFYRVADTGAVNDEIREKSLYLFLAISTGSTGLNRTEHLG